MKKLGLKIALISCVFLLAGNTVQAKETVKKTQAQVNIGRFYKALKRGP